MKRFQWLQTERVSLAHLRSLSKVLSPSSDPPPSNSILVTIESQIEASVTNPGLCQWYFWQCPHLRLPEMYPYRTETSEVQFKNYSCELPLNQSQGGRQVCRAHFMIGALSAPHRCHVALPERVVRDHSSLIRWRYPTLGGLKAKSKKHEMDRCLLADRKM